MKKSMERRADLRMEKYLDPRYKQPDPSSNAKAQGVGVPSALGKREPRPQRSQSDPGGMGAAARRFAMRGQARAASTLLGGDWGETPQSPPWADPVTTAITCDRAGTRREDISPTRRRS